MVIIYTSPGCASCRKAKQWLKENNIEFVEKNIFTSLLNEDEIKYILSRSENGTEDIISVRSMRAAINEACEKACNDSCPNYQVCGAVRQDAKPAQLFLDSESI